MTRRLGEAAFIAGLMACAEPSSHRADRFTLSAPNPATPLSFRLQATLVNPSRLTVHLEASDHALRLPFAAEASRHDVGLHGLLPDRTYDIVVETGWISRRLSTTITTPPLPDTFPEIELLTSTPGRMEHGYTLTNLNGPDDLRMLVALDAQGRVAWWWDTDANWGDTRMLPDGTLLGIGGSDAVNADLFGQTIQRWTREPVEPDDIYMDARLHHELFPLEDGSMLTLHSKPTKLAGYPISYSKPEILVEASIEDKVVLQVEQDGSIRREVLLSDVLDPTRIGFDGLRRNGSGNYDWAHANAVIEAPDGDWIVSVRHQDAVVRMSPEGVIRWILGPHAGWGPAHQPYLLEPEGPLEWPAHQHAPELLEGGALLLFDNGRWRASPYSDPKPAHHATWSRAVAYRVDAEAMTVAQVWEILPPDDLYSAAMGDADSLPETGNVLLHFGFLKAEEDLLNVERGWGDTHIRILEIHPDEPERVLWDVRIRSDRAQSVDGWKGYRAARIPSFYGEDILLGK